MKNTMFNLALPALLLYFAASSTSNPAPVAEPTPFTGCATTLTNRTGTVYSAGPAIQTFTATSDEVTVTVAKTDGRAETQVNIYVNNQFNKKIEFDNGNYTDTKSRTLTGVKNKSIKVEIVNQSVGNTFQYRLTATGESTDLGSDSGNLMGQITKTMTTTRACGNSVKIKLTRTGGNAKGTVYIYRGNTRVHDEIWEGNQNTIEKTFTGSNNQTYRIEVKNISVGNTLKFNMDATQL